MGKLGNSFDLSDFVIEQILGADELEKRINLLGRFNPKGTDEVSMSDDLAVILLKKIAFPKNGGLMTDFLKNLTLEPTMSNDIYYQFDARFQVVPEGLSGNPRLRNNESYNLEIIFPANERHIKKYSEQKYVMVKETPELYESIIKPYIKDLASDHVKWVYNILDGKDLSHNENLHVQALVNRRDIGSLRELRTCHLPLLRSIKSLGLKVLREKYGVDELQIRTYIHYLPTYFHLHIHFSHVNVSNGGTQSGKAVLLDDVIDNLELIDDAYRRKTLMYTLGEHSGLYKKMGFGE